MTFLEQIQAHKGGLICLKTQLYWYGGRGYDKNPGRVCLILDAATVATAAAAGAAARTAARTAATGAIAAALLLVDGSPQWIWVAEEDVELL